MAFCRQGGAGPSLWRLSGGARDQRGHGGGGGVAGWRCTSSGNHAPGWERDLEIVRDGYRRAGLEARVEPFLFAMDREMTAADVVVCRAGATTVAELAACGRASILVPLPTATDDHQRRNAQALVRQGAALLVEQRGPDWRPAGGGDSRSRRRRGSPAEDGGGGAARGAARCRHGDRRPASDVDAMTAAVPGAGVRVPRAGLWFKAGGDEPRTSNTNPEPAARNPQPGTWND